jgi:hypothetical protein
MRKDSTDSRFVPTWREFALRHNYARNTSGLVDRYARISCCRSWI